MPDLNESQFAKYSAVKVPHRVLEYEIKPLPASMERHGKGSYQPTLPGMETMLKGEQTHTDVFFKHPNVADAENFHEIPGSDWWNQTRSYYPKHGTVAHDNLKPSQDWVDDNHLHAPKSPTVPYPEEGKPLVERIPGVGNVIQDGHHRVVRDMLAGLNRSRVARWR